MTGTISADSSRGRGSEAPRALEVAGLSARVLAKYLGHGHPSMT